MVLGALTPCAGGNSDIALLSASLICGLSSANSTNRDCVVVFIGEKKKSVYEWTPCNSTPCCSGSTVVKTGRNGFVKHRERTNVNWHLNAGRRNKERVKLLWDFCVRNLALYLHFLRFPSHFWVNLRFGDLNLHPVLAQKSTKGTPSKAPEHILP